MIQGTVFDIQHFCVDDGPGIRTTVFFKGCPLRCEWCHNAEGLLSKSQLYFSEENCFGCRCCEEVCPAKVHDFSEDVHTIHFAACQLCGACTEVCFNKALRIAGKRMTADEVVTEVAKDKPFFKTSGGGATLSGGEPLMQGEFAVELARLLKAQGIHVCIETSCYCEEKVLREIAEYTDIFLCDFKHYDAAQHKLYTGVDNTRILQNLRLLSGLGKPVILRCPLIPDRNDCLPHYEAIAALANQMKNIIEIHIEPYHPFGVSKFGALGMNAKYTRQTFMDKAVAEGAATAIRARTDTPVFVN